MPIPYHPPFLNPRLLCVNPPVGQSLPGDALVVIAEAEERADPLTAKELRDRWRPVIAWCANHEGLGFKRPVRAPAPGWFWKRDRTQGDAYRAWRLYRMPLS